MSSAPTQVLVVAVLRDLEFMSGDRPALAQAVSILREAARCLPDPPIAFSARLVRPVRFVLTEGIRLAEHLARFNPAGLAFAATAVRAVLAQAPPASTTEPTHAYA